FFHERVFPVAKILTSLHRASPAAPAWSWLSPLEHVGALGAVTETLRRPEEHDMGRLVGGDMDSPGESLLMPLGGHGIAPGWQFCQEERPLAGCIKQALALGVGHDNVHSGRILRARGMFDGKFERQRILRGC